MKISNKVSYNKYYRVQKIKDKEEKNLDDILKKTEKIIVKVILDKRLGILTVIPKLLKGIKKGDLLFFETLEKGRISHVGIYIGNRQFIHASSKSKKVTVSDFSGFYQEKFRWAVSVI